MPLSPLVVVLLAAAWFSLLVVVIIVSGCVEAVEMLIGLMPLLLVEQMGGWTPAGERRMGGVCHP